MNDMTRAALVIDDEPDIRWAMDEILTGMGFCTASTGTAEEAIRLVFPPRFQVAFVDANLPDMDGMDLAKRLRQAQPDLPIVLMSGYYCEEESAVQRYMEEGLIDGFLSKPFTLDELRNATSLAT